jgi:hypothetical protein
MKLTEQNPYASPRAAAEAPAEKAGPSAWHNRLAAVGFLVSLVFPVIALGGLAALLMEDDFGIVRWRVHRLIRLVLFRASIASLVAVAISLASLASSPRRLAVYGVFVGLLGSSYWVLALIGVLRR